MQTDGLSLDQAPPLSVPATFFVTAPLAVMTGGILLLVQGSAVLVASAAPLTVLFTHLGTLGFMSMVMMGALYQMAPVVAGASIPRIRLAFLTHFLLVAGLALLVPALGGVLPSQINIAFSLLWLAIAFFLAHVGWIVIRRGIQSETVSGMRLALGMLLVAATLGSVMAHSFEGTLPLGPRSLWLQVHLGAALFGWVGGLLSAVSWQIVPMFYLTPGVDQRSQRTLLTLIVAGVLGPFVILLLDRIGVQGSGLLAPVHCAAVTALPALLAIWVLHPLQTLREIGRRKRRRKDPSLLFWKAGLCMGFLSAATAIVSHVTDDLRPPLLLGWFAIWGWAGLIIHGMLSRIVPFLVWFHRFSPMVGKVQTPSMRSLLPDRWSHIALFLHVASLVSGALAIGMRSDVMTRATGVLLVLAGGCLLHNLLRVLHRKLA